MTDIFNATHVRSLSDPRIERILIKWRIDEDNRLAPPSKGGFGVITETGRKIDMWNTAQYYLVKD